MVHEGQGLALGLEPGDDLLGVHAQLDDLEGHPAADRLGLLGHIDHPAAALADLFQQLVVADAVAGFLGDGQGFGGHSDGGAGRRRDRFRHEVLGLFVGLEQRLDPLAQCSITGASLIEVSRALFRWQPKRLLEDGFAAFARSIHRISGVSLGPPGCDTCGADR